MISPNPITLNLFPQHRAASEPAPDYKEGAILNLPSFQLIDRLSRCEHARVIAVVNLQDGDRDSFADIHRLAMTLTYDVLA